MQANLPTIAAMYLLAVAGMAAQSGRSPSASAPCDRACLEGVVDRVLDAFVKHDPKALPLARSVRACALRDGIRLEPLGRLDV